MFVLLFLTKVFELLPYNTMAAIIIAGVAGLVEFDTAAYLFRTHLRDFAVWVVAFLSTLFLGIELGLGVAIGLALLIVIFESAFPHTAMLGRIDRSTVYRNIEQVGVWGGCVWVRRGWGDVAWHARARMPGVTTAHRLCVSCLDTVVGLQHARNAARCCVPDCSFPCILPAAAVPLC